VRIDLIKIIGLLNFVNLTIWNVHNILHETFFNWIGTYTVMTHICIYFNNVLGGKYIDKYNNAYTIGIHSW